MDRYVPLPPLPARIGRLNDLAYDLWWSWNVRAREVFRSLDYPLWRFTDHNPVLLLHLVQRLFSQIVDPMFGAFTGSNGWQLDGRARDDGAEARGLYAIIEERLVPDFYSRDKANVGVAWTSIMRRTIMAALPAFSARRAVKLWSAAPPLAGPVG